MFLHIGDRDKFHHRDHYRRMPYETRRKAKNDEQNERTKTKKKKSTDEPKGKCSLSGHRIICSLAMSMYCSNANFGKQALITLSRF